MCCSRSAKVLNGFKSGHKKHSCCSSFLRDKERFAKSYSVPSQQPDIFIERQTFCPWKTFAFLLLPQLFVMRLAFCLFQEYFVISQEQKRLELYIYIYIYSYSYTEAWTIRSQLSSHCVSSTLPAHSLQVDRNMSVQHTALPKIQLTQATFTSDLVTAYTDSNGSIWWGDKKSKHDSQQELKAEHWSQWEPPLTHSWLLFCGQWSQQPSRNGIIKSNSQGWCVINQSMFPTASAH